MTCSPWRASPSVRISAGSIAARCASVGQRNPGSKLGGQRRAPDSVGALEHQGLEPGFREQRRRHQTVVAATDHDRVWHAGHLSFSVLRSAFGVPRSTFVVLRSPCFVLRASFSVLRSPCSFSVLRSRASFHVPSSFVVRAHPRLGFLPGPSGERASGTRRVWSTPEWCVLQARCRCNIGLFEVTTIDAVFQGIERLGGRPHGRFVELANGRGRKSTEAFGEISGNRRGRFTNLRTDRKVSRRGTHCQLTDKLPSSRRQRAAMPLAPQGFWLPCVPGHAQSRPTARTDTCPPTFCTQLNAERRTPNERTPNAERRTKNAERRTENAERRTLRARKDVTRVAESAAPRSAPAPP